MVALPVAYPTKQSAESCEINMHGFRGLSLTTKYWDSILVACSHRNDTNFSA